MPRTDLDKEVLRSLLAAVPDCVLLVDRDGKVCFANHDPFGGHSAELVGEDLLEMMAPLAPTDAATQLDRVFETQEPARQISEIERPDGGKARFEGRLIPIVRDGLTRYVAVVQKDITTRRRADRDPSEPKLLFQCAWCGRVASRDGSWSKTERPERRANSVSHGICPECEGRVTGAGD